MLDIRTGIFFSVSLSARSVYTDIDKAVLAHSASLSINGAYTAAFRLVFMATTPLSAGLVAIQAKMFRAGGSGGLRHTADMAKRAIFVGVIYGGVVGTGLYVAAPLLPYLLGAKYTASIEMLQMLAFLPIPLFIQSALSDALCAANFQRVRSFVQIGVAILSFGLNTLLVKEFSWRGAVLATYCCQISLVIMMTYMVVSLLNKKEG
jgi:O-antigen/teichoic acid export membrane protein